MLKKLFKKPFFVRSKKDAREKKLNAEKEKMSLLVDALKEVMRENPLSLNDSIAEWTGGNKDVYLYDFTGEFAGVDNIIGEAVDAVGALISDNPIKEPKAVVKPVDVFHELERVPRRIDLKNLDEKIAVFNTKAKFIRKNKYAKKEVIDFVTRLENRKRYDEFKDFFERFDNTTTDKINALLSKYTLVLESSDLFIPKFPKEAIRIMEDYEEKTLELCGKKPVFYVIAEEKDFNREYDRNDPILLVQSPFGIYWQILGAWDKEMLLLEEL